jgi:HD-GYP domain-containing protein (c-di-GMP phosphodiesterase class II)
MRSMDSEGFRQQLFSKGLRIIRSHSPAEDVEYLPLSFKVLMGGEAVPCGLYLKVGGGEGPDISFAPCLEEGEVLLPEVMEPLQSVGIQRFYIRARDVEEVIAYLNNRLLASTDDLDAAPRLELLREHLGLSLRLAFGSPRLGKHIDGAGQVLEKVIDCLEKDSVSWEFMGEIIFQDYSLYNHSVNVALLGMAMMVFLESSKDDCLTMGLAGLFHDLGLTRVSEEVIYRVEPLRPRDWDLVRDHPQESYRLLRENPHLSAEVKRLVLEHHEHADGSGYPAGLTLAEQHPLTRIFHLLDAYDALTSHRPYRRAIKPFAALKILQEQRGTRGPAYDPATLKSFIRFLSLI